MASQRYLNTKFWDDTYIIELDPSEKLIYIYLLTNPLTNIAGIYEISLRRISLDTGIDSEMIKKILDRFQDADKIMYVDGILAIKNFIKHQKANPKIVTGIESIKKTSPEWAIEFIEDRLCIGYDSLSHVNTNTNDNNNFNDNELEEKTNSFKNPNTITLEEYENIHLTKSELIDLASWVGRREGLWGGKEWAFLVFLIAGRDGWYAQHQKEMKKQNHYKSIQSWRNAKYFSHEAYNRDKKFYIEQGNKLREKIKGE